MRSAVLLAAVVVVTRATGEELATVSNVPDTEVTATVAAYAGTYVYAGGEAERAAVKVAIDRATEDMFGMFIARGELMKRSEVRSSYTIRFESSGRVSVETPGFPAEAAPLDGTEVVLRTKYGDVVRSSQRVVGGALLQSGWTDDGSGFTQFRLQPDGDTLVVTRVSESPKLPRAVEFMLTYRRETKVR